MTEQRNAFEDSLIAYRTGGDARHVPLRQVGITKLTYPLTVWDRTNQTQRTVGVFKLTVDLPREFVSTHRSRLISALEVYQGDVSLETMADLVDDMRNRLDAERAHVRVDFKYFIRKKAPISERNSWLGLDCWFIGDAGEKDANFTLGVLVPVTSRIVGEDEEGNATSQMQRGFVRVSIRFRELVWLEELVEYVEEASSASVMPLLKREDELELEARAVAMPTSVEDLVRNVADTLVKDQRVTWFYVEAETEPPMRDHSNYAAVGSNDL